MGTVGGPIDVALITKHEGFVWIKRKQHFDPNLNPRYFWRRYGKNIGGGGYGAGASWAEGSAEGAAASQQPDSDLQHKLSAIVTDSVKSLTPKVREIMQKHGFSKASKTLDVQG